MSAPPGPDQESAAGPGRARAGGVAKDNVGRLRPHILSGESWVATHSHLPSVDTRVAVNRTRAAAACSAAPHTLITKASDIQIKFLIQIPRTDPPGLESRATPRLWLGRCVTGIAPRRILSSRLGLNSSRKRRRCAAAAAEEVP